MVNPKYRSIPVFFKQPGVISQGKENDSKLYLDDPEEKDIYLHKLVNKLKANEPTGVSRHTVWQLDRDPCIEPVSREDLAKFLSTLNKSKPVKFFKETGEEIDGDRVVEQEDLARLVQILPEIVSDMREHLLDQADIERPERLKEAVYTEVGQTIDQNPVYDQKFVKRKPKIYDNNNMDSIEANKSRVDRERSIEYLNKSPIPGESRIIKPILDNFSKTQVFIGSDDEDQGV